jgi:hypothetical protein
MSVSREADDPAFAACHSLVSCPVSARVAVEHDDVCDRRDAALVLGGQIADIRIRLEALQKRSIHARSIWSTFVEAVRKK